MAQSSSSYMRAFEDVFGIPRGLIAKDPEGAAIIATVPCPKCGTAHGVNPCYDPAADRIRAAYLRRR